ncbi:MAG: galactokinase [Deltaproteobacteria bacterium]
MIKEILKTFKDLYGSNPSVFRSPGRINIIGEHTDYNQGFVLPAAIDKELYFAVAHNSLNKFRFFAYDLNSTAEIPCDMIEIQKKETWSNYLLGVVSQLSQKGIKVSGLDVVVGGNIPIGAGLSSSAAMECGFIYAVDKLFSLGMSNIEMVKLAQNAEHEFAGVKCGIMDQFTVMHGKADRVIKLDCRSLDFSYEPLDLGDYHILLCNTEVKHNLASSEYNIRRQECEQGVEIVSGHFPGIHSLRDVTMEQLESCRDQLTGKVFNRCSFVIEENTRLEQTCLALEQNDLQKAGKMIFGSHDGLKNKYNVSCKELDQLVEIAASTEGILGARMMGGGFGGCTINIIHKDAIPRFRERVLREYYNFNNIPHSIYEVSISEGTSQLL